MHTPNTSAAGEVFVALIEYEPADLRGAGDVSLAGEADVRVEAEPVREILLGGIAGRAVLAAVEHYDAACRTACHAAAGVCERDAVGDTEFEERLARLDGQCGGFRQHLNSR